METKTKYLIAGLLIALAIISYGIFNAKEQIRKDKCYEESFELWNSVNTDYTYVMSSQESYDKNNRQSCASMYYVSCINGDNINCAATARERLNDANEVDSE